MANNINLPTYEQVEGVGQSVENIETIVNNGVGTKWEDYSPYQRYVTAAVSTVESEIFNISGSGYFSRIVFFADANGFSAKIFVDGVLFGTFDVSNINVGGVSTPDFIKIRPDSTGIWTYYNRTTNATSIVGISRLAYGLSPSTLYDYMKLISEPLFFKESVSIRVVKSSGSGNFSCNIDGGIK